MEMEESVRILDGGSRIDEKPRVKPAIVELWKASRARPSLPEVMETPRRSAEPMQGHCESTAAITAWATGGQTALPRRCFARVWFSGRW